MEFKREDYIYLRYVEDDPDNLIKKGDIIRFSKKYLIRNLVNRQFGNLFYRNGNNYLFFEQNPDAIEDDIMYDKVYKSIQVRENINQEIILWENDYLYLDDWLFEHLSQESIQIIQNLNKEYLSDNNRLVKLKQGSPDVYANIRIHFNKGEVLDFTNPSTAILFYKPYFLQLFANTEIITDEEKKQIFEKNFAGTIFEKEVSECQFEQATKVEQRYYKIKSAYKTKDIKELNKHLNRGYICEYTDNDVIRDKEGYITYIVYTVEQDKKYCLDLEEDYLTIADRLNSNDAMKVYLEECRKYLKESDEFHKKLQAEDEKEEKRLYAMYKKQKNNADIFPGTHGEFKHSSDEKSTYDEKYTLQQIKDFFKQLSQMDTEIINHLCIYGGTIPYLLTNAMESRNFGDVDIFIPIEFMSKFRDILKNEPSFEMLCDSKKYTKFSMLTTRIPREPKEIVVNENSNLDIVQNLFDTFTYIMAPPQLKKYYVDDDGKVHSPIHYHKEAQLPFYRVLQDFGFKGKLFGVNISVFPMYEYENDIMAKSFNANNDTQYLLGIKIMKNTKIKDFVKNVNLCGASLNILPLEYTIASKQGAIKDKYYKRFDKDKEDIEYILNHKEELGIDDNLLQEILDNYPDYSVSIAYAATDPVEIMSGEAYKKLVFSDRLVT